MVSSGVLPVKGNNFVCDVCCLKHGWAVSSVRVRDSPPPPLRALRAHLVTKGQWLLAIHRGNVSALGARRASFWTRAPPVTF